MIGFCVFILLFVAVNKEKSDGEEEEEDNDNLLDWDSTKKEEKG